MITAEQPTPPFGRNLVNLADPRLGAEALYATDDFFAPKERMLNPEPAVFIPGKYDEHGKWMDGWESRRKRGEGHDYVVVKLGLPGILAGFDIDTSHFTGNYPPAASVEACHSDGEPGPGTAWSEIVPATALKGNSHHFVAVSDERVWTHLKLNIFPDGGVARLRAYGRIAVDWAGFDAKQLIDLAAVVHGGRAIACSDQHYGSPMQVLFPGRGINMGDGWETRRRREPGNDWAIFALGHRGRIRKIEIDTAHFKGNYPDRCSILAAEMKGGTEDSLVTQSMFWRVLLPEQKLEMDRPHLFQKEIADLGPVTHVRLNIIPDGGVSRMRLWGELA
jgi:allantoicase